MDYFALRWESKSRYYAVYLHSDLWGERLLTRVWGGKGSRLGGQQSEPIEPERIEQAIAEIAKRRSQHRYQPADEITKDLVKKLTAAPP